MEPTDITVEILTDIRTELRGTRDEIRTTREELSHRIETTNERVDALSDELSRRIVASEVRTATAIADLAGSVHQLTDVLRASHDLRPRVERCERDIAELQKRIG